MDQHNWKGSQMVRKLGLMMLTVLGLLGLAACSGDNASPATATPSGASAQIAGATQTPGRPAVMKDVTVGYSPLLTNAPFYLGIDKGYFLDEGINLKLQTIGTGADVLTQTAAGNFDIGSAGIGAAGFNMAAAAIKAKQDVPFEVAAALHIELPPANTPLVVSKARMDSGEITKVADLKGKKCAVNNLGSATEFWLNMALKSGGLTTKDVTVVAMGFGTMAAALQSKSIDCAMLGEPLVTQSADAGMVKVLTDSFAKGEAATAVYWNRNWAKNNPQLAAGFLRAFLKSAAEMEKGGWKDPAIIAIMEKYTQVPADVIKRAATPHYPTGGKLDPQGWKDLEAYFRSAGELTYDGNVDLTAFFRQ